MTTLDRSFSISQGINKDVKASGESNVEKREIFSIVRRCLSDLLDSFENGRHSFRNKTEEFKLNYLENLLRETLEKGLENVDLNNLTLSKDDKTLIKAQASSILKELSGTQINKIQEEIEKILDEAFQKNSSQTSKDQREVKVVDVKNEDFLIEYFDNLYKKNEQFADLKRQIGNQIISSGNNNLKLFKDRVSKFQSLLKDYHDNIIKLEQKLKQQRLASGGKGERIDVGQSKEEQREREKKEEQYNNLIKNQLTSKQIEDQVRKNEQLAKVPDAKQLSAQHMQSGDNLVDKFYKNGKFELKMKRLKSFMGLFTKVFGFIMSPIMIRVKAAWKVIKGISTAIFKLGKFVFKKTVSMIAPLLCTPAGAYLIGFTAGVVVEFIKQKLVKDPPGWISTLFGTIMEYMVKPLIEIGKRMFKLISWVVDLVVKHPMIFTSLVGFVGGIAFMIQHFTELRLGVALLKGGLKTAGPFLVGMASSAAVEGVLNETIYKSKTEDSLMFTGKNIENAVKMSSEINTDILSSLNDTNLQKYNEVRQIFDEETMQITQLYKDLEFLDKLYTQDDDTSEFRTTVGDGFLNNVFDSPMFGEDTTAKNDFISKQSKKGTKIRDMIKEISDYLGKRAMRLQIAVGSFAQATKNGVADLTRYLNEMVEQKEIIKDGKVIGVTNTLKKDYKSKVTNAIDLEGWKALPDKVKTTLGMSHLLHGEKTYTGKEISFNGQDIYNRDDGYRFENSFESKMYSHIDELEPSKRHEEISLANQIKELGGFTRVVEIPKPKRKTGDKNDVRMIAFREITNILKAFATENNLNVSGFGNLIATNPGYMEEVKKIYSTNRENLTGLTKSLNEYFGKVKEQYVDLERQNIKAVDEDIKDIDSNIARLTGQQEQLNKDIQNLKDEKKKLGGAQ